MFHVRPYNFPTKKNVEKVLIESIIHLYIFSINWMDVSLSTHGNFKCTWWSKKENAEHVDEQTD